MAKYNVQEKYQLTIFGPFFATMLLTIVVWVYMYIRRISFIKSTNYPVDQMVRPEDFARASPPAVLSPSDNLKNLFEVPVLFYAITLYLFVTKQVDSTYVTAAWIFFAFRVLHSAVHCTINIILVRFYLYLASCIALFFMIFRAMSSHFFF